VRGLTGGGGRLTGPCSGGWAPAEGAAAINTRHNALRLTALRSHRARKGVVASEGRGVCGVHASPVDLSIDLLAHARIYTAQHCHSGPRWPEHN
jgi:hypothetical protein